MQKPPPPPARGPRPAAPETDRKKHLASALRENLRRRKRQSRVRDGKEPR